MSNWPLFQFVQDLEGFDLVALLLGAAIAFFSAGFAIDYIVGRYGMGPYWNGPMRCLELMRGSARAIGGSNPTSPTTLI